MGKIVIPKNSASVEETMEAIRLYYEANDWLTNEDFINRYRNEVGILCNDTDSSAYTKKGQIGAYYGFIEWQDIKSKTSPRRITDRGRVFYEHYINNDIASMHEDLMRSLEEITFGRNNFACPTSDTDVEPPILFLRAALDLGYLTNDEFAYLVYRMSDCGDLYSDCIREIKRVRLVENEKLNIPDEANKYKDIKPIIILERWGVLTSNRVENQKGTRIDSAFLLKYKNRLQNLKIYNIDRNVFGIDKLSLAQIAEIVSNAEIFESNEDYEYFNSNYSINVLKSLSDTDLAKRLFASKEYANANNCVRGYAIWAEHGNGTSKPFGTAKSHTGGQGGVVLKADGSYNIYEYSFESDATSGKKKKKCLISVLEEDDALLLAMMIRDCLSRICDYIQSHPFNSKSDYESLLNVVKDILKSANENRLYWNEDGDPDAIIMKYLHCSFPNLFGCCYARDKLKKLLLPVFDDNELSDNALVLNGQFSLLANSLPIVVDNNNFGRIWWNYVFNNNSISSSSENIEDDENMTTENEQRFREWFANQITVTGRKCSPSMIYNNCKALKDVCKLMNIVEYPDVESLFEITDIDVFFDIRDIIKGHDDYNEVNVACGNRFLSSGLKWYEKYLNEINTEVVEEPSYDSYSKDDFLNDVFMDSDRYDELVKLLKYKKNIILQGAPGVGKTFLAKRLAYSIIGKKSYKQVESIQFHQSYSYEDFIMGYKPVDDGFELQMGIFYTFCKKAEADPENDYFFIIDEINRGNLSKIFGELLMLIEGDKRGNDNRIKLAYKNEYFYVPEKVYIIGMMNTADRSLAMMDYALRRRFCFFEVEPAFGNAAFTKKVEELTGSKQIAKKVNDKFKKLNEIIADEDTSGLGKGFCIGHSYFCISPIEGQSAEEWYSNIIKYEISPLLDEYWWDDKNKAKDCKDELLND